MEQIICTKCKVKQFTISFYKWQKRCKTCTLAYQKERALQKKNEIKLYKQKYQKQHSEELALISKKYYWSNRSELLKRARVYHSSETAHIKRRKYVFNRRRTDLLFRLQNNLRQRLRLAITFAGAKKHTKTAELIGCSIKDFKKHIEKQFKTGMTWKNYGRAGWHIDHIRPCADFDLIQKSEQQQCFHYSNLQPLWANENYKKGSFYNNSSKIQTF